MGAESEVCAGFLVADAVVACVAADGRFLLDLQKPAAVGCLDYEGKKYLHC